MIWSSVIGRGKRAAQAARTNGIEHFESAGCKRRAEATAAIIQRLIAGKAARPEIATDTARSHRDARARRRPWTT
jgi:hypothetical protein